jgi:hypothetical protein
MINTWDVDENAVMLSYMWHFSGSGLPISHVIRQNNSIFINIPSINHIFKKCVKEDLLDINYMWSHDTVIYLII